jgi:RNA polymerase sigma factor for flagellar operon FliA
VAEALVLASLEDAWKTYRETGDHTCRERLVIAYVGLVKSVVGRMSVSRVPGAEYDDLVSSGILGLIDAIDRFDPDKGVKFEAYATTRIRGAVLDACRKNDWVPRSVRQTARRLERVYSAVENRLGRSATDVEIADEMGIAVEELEKMLREINGSYLVSLDETVPGVDDDDSITIADRIEDTTSPAPDELAADASALEVLTEAVCRLPERERLVVSLYYNDGLTLREIGEVMGVTESRVSQLHTKAILRLRGRLARARTQHAV